MTALGCIVLAYPRDGGAPIPFRGTTEAVMRAAEKAEAQPEKYAEVAVATVFRSRKLEDRKP